MQSSRSGNGRITDDTRYQINQKESWLEGPDKDGDSNDNDRAVKEDNGWMAGKNERTDDISMDGMKG